MPPSNSPLAARPAIRQASRRKTRIALGLSALLAVAAWWGWGPLTMQATAGTAFGARTGCACRYIGGRELGDCEKDFVAGMSLVSLSEDAAVKSVTARVPLLSSTTATYREGWGCMLERFGD